MARQLRIEYAGALYHVTARGNERKDIYINDKDREKFLEYIQLCHERWGIKIHGYCLMNNHYHLLLETPQANLSRSMQYLNTGYSIYYNLNHKRTGHLFQGRYKAILVEKDEYLLELSRYIHLNPVRAGITKKPEEYFWSSYKFFFKDVLIPEYLELETTMSYFKDKKEYERFVSEGIGKGDKELTGEIVSGCLLGTEGFIEEITKKYLMGEKRLEDLPGLKELKKRRVDQATMLKTINEDESISEKDKIKLIIYFMRKFTDKTLREIAEEYFKGRSISGVNKVVKRVEDRIRKEGSFGEIIKSIEEKMSKVKV